MMQRKGIAALFLVFAIALVMTACSSARKPIPDDEVPVPPGSDGTPPAQSIPAAIFFADWQAQHLIPEARQIPDLQGAALATQIVKEILSGPTDPHLYRALPADVKLLEPVRVENSIAYVNLSKELAQTHGSAGANMNLNSLRLSLTELPGITKVQVLVEGKRTEALEGMTLELLDRGFYGDFPVLPNPERAAYLQDRVEQGLDRWRTDPTQVLEWEGRMFGFTADELKAAEVVEGSNRSVAALSRGGNVYEIELLPADPARPETAWVINAIDLREAGTGPAVAVYFSDWQGQHPIPEARTVGGETGETLATRVVQEVLAGPMDPHLFPTLPGVTLLEPVRLQDGTATVNLSSSLLDIQGSTGARMAVQSLVLSLTDLPGIERVQLLAGGRSDVVHDAISLGRPLDRTISAYNPIPDPARISYLQQQADEGKAKWRTDPAAVLQWEGRMFGFTAQELEGAALERQGAATTARLSKNGVTYTISLSQQQNVTGIWVIDAISEKR